MREKPAYSLDKGDERSRGQRTTDHAETTGHMLQPLLYRPVWLPVTIASVFLAVSLGVLLVTSWNSVNRLQPVRRHMEQLSRLQEAGLNLQEMLVGHLGGNKPIETAKLEVLRQEVGDIIALDSHLVPTSPVLLREAQATLGDLAGDPREALIAVLAQIRKVVTLETRAHNELVAEINRAAALEFDIVVATIIILPSLALLTFFLVRKRVLVPLSTLGRLLTMLGRRDYTPMPAEDVDPMLKPLISSYNDLVVRLAQLEGENARRQKTLEHQVRAATEALLEQQRTLAAAERLAAVGEVAAGIAHELRNPLAGMQMALSNLRSDTANREHAERLDLIIAEVRRITSLLNGLLEGARHTPEPLADVELSETVNGLLVLARHQIPGRIRIDWDIQVGLDCRLPRDRFKQALLNLVVNAAQAIGDREGLITVSAQRDAGTVALVVCDNGPGFPPAVLENGSRPFVTGRRNGTGLGLAIVKRLARDLSGELRLSNVDPHGARVELRLPCRTSDD
jgi:two-component system, NtrC family, sensor kinase